MSRLVDKQAISSLVILFQKDILFEPMSRFRRKFYQGLNFQLKYFQDEDKIFDLYYLKNSQLLKLNWVDMFVMYILQWGAG